MSNRNKWIGALLVIVLVGVVVAYANRQRRQTTIKIGATNSLTGKYALRGEQTKHGMELAVAEINAAGGVNGTQLELITEDNQGDPKGAVSGVNKLLETDRVDFILSAFTGVTNAIKDIVAKHGKVMIYASTVSDIAKSNPYFFMDYYKAEDHGKAMASLVAKRGIQTVKYLSEVSDPCKKFGAAFATEAGTLGVKIAATETYATTDTDMKTQLLKLKTGKKFNALVLCSWQHEQIIMPELAQLNMLSIPTFHWLAPFLAAAQTPEMNQLFSQSKATTIWYGFSDGDASDTTQAKFIAAYQAKYGARPIPDAAYSYDDIYLIAHAARDCPSLEVNCLRDSLLKADFVGAGGHVAFDADRIMQRDMVIMESVSGNWQTMAQ